MALQLLQKVQPLLAPAAALAPLLREHWAQPEQAAANQLAVARVAAARSCAYLCCANLGGEGGPAAGQGVGSQRCRCGRWDGWRQECVSEQGSMNTCRWCQQETPDHLPPPSLLPYPAAPAVRCGTAAPPARTPPGGRAGTAACARRWVQSGRQRRRRDGRRRRRGRAELCGHACVLTILYSHTLEHTVHFC